MVVRGVDRVCRRTVADTRTTLQPLCQYSGLNTAKNFAACLATGGLDS